MGKQCQEDGQRKYVHEFGGQCSSQDVLNKTLFQDKKKFNYIYTEVVCYSH